MAFVTSRSDIRAAGRGRFLTPTDLLVIGFTLLLTVIVVLVRSRLPAASGLLAGNAAACVLVFVLAYAAGSGNGAVARIAHDWYPVVLVALGFKEMRFLVGAVHGGGDCDALLIAADRWLFGTDPTVWMARFSHPLLTEILQIAYTSFYFLFLLLGVELYRRKGLQNFHLFMFTCVYGFFLSYLGYFLLPAVGPRFTLHDFGALDTDLPGLALTPLLRWLVNAGGSVPPGAAPAVALAAVQRDAFPSGHTMMTLVLMMLARTTRARVAPVVYVVGALLIVATVYQRYHYVVDLLAGAAFTVFCLLTAEPVRRLLAGTARGRVPDPVLEGAGGDQRSKGKNHT